MGVCTFVIFPVSFNSSIICSLADFLFPSSFSSGTLSTCYAAGFALEAKCHQGKTILYDTVNKLGWSVDIRTHRFVLLSSLSLLVSSSRTDLDPLLFFPSSVPASSKSSKRSSTKTGTTEMVERKILPLTLLIQTTGRRDEGGGNDLSPKLYRTIQTTLVWIAISVSWVPHSSSSHLSMQADP